MTDLQIEQTCRLLKFLSIDQINRALRDASGSDEPEWAELARQELVRREMGEGYANV